MKTVLKDLSLEQILNSNNQVKIKKIEAEKIHGLRNLTFWKLKFLKEATIIVVILLTIIYLSYVDKIENSTVGTLLGSIIGYAVGNFN